LLNNFITREAESCDAINTYINININVSANIKMIIIIIIIMNMDMSMIVASHVLKSVIKIMINKTIRIITMTVIMAISEIAIFNTIMICNHDQSSDNL
jgi:hypothetical protein